MAGELIERARGGSRTPGSAVYDLYKDSGAVRLRRKHDDVVVGSWGEGGAAFTALLAEGDLPATVNVRARGGLIDVTTQAALPAGRAYSPMFIGESPAAGFRFSNAAPKPFSLAAGTLAAPLTYRMPVYRRLTFDANADNWAGSKQIGFFGQDAGGGQGYMLFADVPEYDELYLRCGKTFAQLEAEGSWFSWFDWRVTVGADYDPTTAPWWTTAAPKLRRVTGWSDGSFYGAPTGGIGFYRAAVQFGSGHTVANPTANIRISPGYAYGTVFNTGSLPTKTDGFCFYLGSRGHPVRFQCGGCTAFNVGDVAMELDQLLDLEVYDWYTEDCKSALLWNNFGDPYEPGVQSAYVDGLTVVTRNTIDRSTDGIKCRSHAGVTEVGGLTVRGYTRKYLTATIPRQARRALIVYSGYVGRFVDVEMVIEDSGPHGSTGWVWDGNGTNLRSQIRMMGGTPARPNDIRVKVRHRIRGSVNNSGGTSVLTQRGIEIWPGFYGKLALDYTGDVQVGGLGLPAGAYQPITHGFGGGNTTQGQADEVDLDATAGTWTFAVGANTTAALAYNIEDTDLQTALEGLASVGVGKVTVSLDILGTTYAYTITFDPTLGALATSVNGTGLTGIAQLFNVIAFGSTSNEYGSSKVAFVKGSVGVPSTIVEQWDPTAVLLGPYSSRDWDDLYLPAGATRQGYGTGVRPSRLALDVSAGGPAVLWVGRIFGTNNLTMTANNLVGFEFEVPDTLVAGSAGFCVGAQSGNMEIVVLDVADSYRRIATTGSFAMPAAGQAAQAFLAAVTLRKGERYWVGWICDNATGSLTGTLNSIPNGACQQLAGVGIPCPALPGTPATNSIKAPSLIVKP